MASKSPTGIGEFVWKEIPTVRSLVKMIVSNRYRFPTVDCDDAAREQMKQGEQASRDREAAIAEQLFLPRPKVKVESDKKVGVRISKRLLKQQQEKSAAERLEETMRRKRQLKIAQKSIMIWDPFGHARKPPREVGDLLLSVEASFSLPETFHRSTNPDFLLLTLGGTSRGSIERSYEWLIPVISRFPDVISRLPSSASCFLLLRAYGSDADERSRLKELSSPLLSHVAGCLNGNYGKLDCVTAFDLLISDVASHKAERRRCARRVLHDSLLSVGGQQSWMTKILGMKYANDLIGDGVKYMSLAATFERGGVLKSLIVALEAYLRHARSIGMENVISFPELLVGLVSNRPGVLAETMSSFSELRSLVVRVIRSEFNAIYEEDNKITPAPEIVCLRTRKTPPRDWGAMRVPSTLLLSTCVVLSIWEDSEENVSVDELVDALMRTSIDEDEDIGLGSATFADSGEPALTVESWIMLAKSRSDRIARRAALSAPTAYLPRLLMCSGLPRASLVTMVDRLGHLGETAGDKKGDMYRKLLESCTTREVDRGASAKSGGTARKLLGRLAAYIRLFELPLREASSSLSTSFVSWLVDECRSIDASPHQAPLKSRVSDKRANGSIAFVPSLQMQSILEELEVNDATSFVEASSRYEVPAFVSDAKAIVNDDGREVSLETIDDCIRNADLLPLDSILRSFDFFGLVDSTAPVLQGPTLATQIINSFVSLEHKNEGTIRLIHKWVPRLSASHGSDELYLSLFSDEGANSRTLYLDDLVTRCAQTWRAEHVASFVDWILESPAKPQLSLSRVVRFIYSASGAPSVHIDHVSDPSALSNVSVVLNLSPTKVTALASMAITLVSSIGKDIAVAELCNRNVANPAASLLMLVAGKDRESTREVTDLILEVLLRGKKPEHPNAALQLEVLLLRIYLLNPNWMNLGNAPVRAALLTAAQHYPRDWITWRTSFDDQIENMMDTLLSGEKRLTRPLVDLSRSHPLLVLRLIPDVIALLEGDAVVGNSSNSFERTKGRFVGSLRASTARGGDVSVAVRHWGSCYSEPLWFALLDVVTSIPNELLFGAGLKLGILDVLETYLKLLTVQHGLVSAEKVKRLDEKLREVFSAFRRTNAVSWKSWLGADVDELGREVRQVLMTCNFITPQEAIESLKDAE